MAKQGSGFLGNFNCSLLVPMIGVVLVYSACKHLGNGQQFLVSILRYELVPFALAPFIAVLLPPLQIALGIGLIFDLAHRFVRPMAAIVLFGFFACQASASIRGLAISCGCFSSSGENIIGPQTMALPLITSTLVVVAILTSRVSDSEAIIKRSKES